MGDSQVVSGKPNGGVMEDHPCPSLLSQPLGPSNPDPSSIDGDCWAVAEETTQEVIRCIHPTLDSEEKRKDVIDYVQRLIRNSLGCEVFPYGSVPLKTYLPDGDIDLTALSSPNIEESLACDVLAVLQIEEHNEKPDYEVKDTQFIDAEVKLVKCLVQNIVIDISFNQLGGLGTLCFLEQVDRLVGKNHLFKRSIILIKAWCYYESRILGAHHGLISTYALETLVLYIFHMFHSSLNGPLAVLYIFLDYFSKFDWDNYCISLNGPVCRSSLPDIVVEMPKSEKNDFMFSEEFLRNCVDMFSVSSRGLETSSRAFSLKHLNIIDPLKENNNLGRSVHRGNFYRVRSAFKHGSRKLGRILVLPKERIGEETKKFFTNTLERHGRKYGVDIQNPSLAFDDEEYCDLSSLSHVGEFSEDDIHLKSLNLDSDGDISGVEHKHTSVSQNGQERCQMRADILQMMSESGYLNDGPTVLGNHLAGVANDLARSGLLCSRGPNGMPDSSTPRSNFSSSHSGSSCHASQLHIFGLPMENGNLCQKNSPDYVDGTVSCELESGENHLLSKDTSCSGIDNHEGISCSGSAISSPDADISDSLSLDSREADALNPLSDLSGDYDSHIRSLLYGQCCHGYALSAPVLSNPPISPSQLPKNKSWDTFSHWMPFKQTSYSEINSNGVILEPCVFPVTNFTAFIAPFGSEEKHKARGTGTYFPKTNRCSCKEKFSQGMDRNKAQGTQCQLHRHRHRRKNGGSRTLDELNTFEKCSYDLANTMNTMPAVGCEKSGSSSQSHQSVGGTVPANGFSNSCWNIEFGSLGPVSEGGNLLGFGTPRDLGSTPGVVSEVQNLKPGSSKRQERVGKQSYSLKNEDFPPLSVQML